MQTILIRKMSFVSLFKLFLIGFAVFLVPLMTIGALSAYFGFGTWEFNGEQLHGTSILLNAVLCVLIMPVVFSAFFGGITYIGQFIYGKFRPISIKVLAD